MATSKVIAGFMMLLIIMVCGLYYISIALIIDKITSVYREKKHPYDCFTNLSEDKSIPMTAL